jgi:hypothetical protein
VRLIVCKTVKKAQPLDIRAARQRFAALIVAIVAITASFLVAPRAVAAAGSLSVPATADLFAAGQSTVPAFAGGGGTLPPSLAVTPGEVLTISASGTIDCGSNAPSGPDGSTGGGTVDIQSYGGISGFGALGGIACGLSLSGVFTGSSAPVPPPPARLDFVDGSGEGFTSISPLIDQGFFVGDGLTGTGTGSSQTFVVPAGATTLWLGFIDGQTYTSAPGYYDDNSGSVSVQVNSTGATTTVISDSYASVEYIQSFSLSGCITDLIQHRLVGPAKATALCSALRLSANSAPPTQLNAQTIGPFEASKEYRGFMMVPSFAVTCSAAGEVLSTTLAGDSPFYASLGFTKAPDKIYSSGESYNPQDPSFDTGVLAFVTDPDGAVTISYRWASRIATLERDAQYRISGYDAPFVWLTFDEKIGCSGQQEARFDYTNFPATDLYINGAEVSHSGETNSFANFMAQGGRVLHPPGYGNLAFPCNIRQFDNGNSQPVYSYSACQDNQLPAGAGTGGGGSL